LINALKTNRIHELVRSKDTGFGNNNGLAVISDDICIGGGNLGFYGINSNTSAAGFLKCLYALQKKQKKNNVPI